MVFIFCSFLAQDKKEWTIGDSLKSRVETFDRTMPLIQDLKNPAIRERHWEQLKDEIQHMFDHTGDSFTLEKIMELSLEQHYATIESISNAASKELIIERVSRESVVGYTVHWRLILLILSVC